MQLGTRWPIGGELPQNLPHVVQVAVQAVEEELDAVGEDTSAWRWTLTWLEGKPVIELDDGTVIRYNAGEDSATITQPSVAIDDEEDWI
jgi:AAA+ ATPase superfamily predicted ATPase